MMYNTLVGSDVSANDNSEGSPEYLVGGSKRMVPQSHHPLAFVEARPLSISGFFTSIPTALQARLSGQVPAGVEAKGMRLLTSQRSQPYRGTGRNRQTGKRTISLRYRRLEEESVLKGAVAVKVAEVREVSLIGLSMA
jgi:hypothetical protein